jgi:hypothetical protein
MNRVFVYSGRTMGKPEIGTWIAPSWQLDWLDACLGDIALIGTPLSRMFCKENFRH